jgi:chromosome segregation ATPase
MTRERIEPTDDMDRRSFLKALAASGAAATALGGGAALLANRAKSAPVTTTLVSPVATTLPPVREAVAATPAGADTSDLLARLASAQAENLRLQTELDAAHRRLAGLEAANGDSEQVVEALQIELASANNRVSLLAGLVALYEQLEDLDLAQTVNSGLDAFGLAIDELVGELPGLEAGLNLGRDVLAELESQLPSLQNGRIWLEGHMSRLATFYEAAERELEAAVESAGSFLQKVNEWFQNLLKWVPFRAGQRAAEVMDALTNLIDETPRTVAGLRSNVATPLDAWLQEENGDLRVRTRFVKPLQEQTLQPASRVADRARHTRAQYEAEIVEPVRTAAKSRNLIREQIAAYRKKYEI